jgi:NitT/TauT family transport system ATP-binding protein
MTTHPLIEVKSLNHYYGPPPGGHLVLEDVNLTLNQNEVVGLLGRSARASRHCCAPSRG